MSQTITPFLMFDGTAEQAIRAYVSIFEDAEIRSISRYGPCEQGAEGSVRRADVRLAGRDFIAIDTPVTHAFGFTPALSLFVDFDSEAALDSAVGADYLDLVVASPKVAAPPPPPPAGAAAAVAVMLDAGAAD